MRQVVNSRLKKKNVYSRTRLIGNIFTSYKFFFQHPRVFDYQKHHKLTKRIFGHQKYRHVSMGRQVPSLTPHDTVHPNGCHVSMGHQVPRGHQVPNGCQVPSLTLCDMVRLDGHQVPNVRQVPSLTQCDTIRPDGCHVSMGRQVPRVVRYLTVIRYLP